VATLDNHHQKIRQQIRFASEAAGGGGSGHLKAGIKALGHGLFGGLTSIVAQTYTGVTEDGFEVSSNGTLNRHKSVLHSSFMINYLISLAKS